MQGRLFMSFAWNSPVQWVGKGSVSHFFTQFIDGVQIITIGAIYLNFLIQPETTFTMSWRIQRIFLTKNASESKNLIQICIVDTHKGWQFCLCAISPIFGFYFASQACPLTHFALAAAPISISLDFSTS